MSRLDHGRLEDALRQLASVLAQEEPPLAVESAARAAFERERRRRQARRWVTGLGTLAAGLALVWMGQMRPEKKPVAPPAAALTDLDQPFVPIPYVLPPAPYERVEVVRMQVPVAALIAAGLAVETSDPGAEAEADVLVGQDGRPRAVRLVSISSFN